MRVVKIEDDSSKPKKQAQIQTDLFSMSAPLHQPFLPNRLAPKIPTIGSYINLQGKVNIF